MFFTLLHIYLKKGFAYHHPSGKECREEGEGVLMSIILPKLESFIYLSSFGSEFRFGIPDSVSGYRFRIPFVDSVYRFLLFHTPPCDRPKRQIVSHLITIVHKQLRFFLKFTLAVFLAEVCTRVVDFLVVNCVCFGADVIKI